MSLLAYCVLLGYFTKASLPPLFPPLLSPPSLPPPPLLPRAPRFLVQQLAANMPYKGRPAAALELHLRSLLYVTDYQPGLRREVLRLAVEQLVQLDVELPHLSLESPTGGHEGAALGGGELLFDVDMVKCSLQSGGVRALTCSTPPLPGRCPTPWC